MPGILYQKNSKPSSSTGGGILFKKSVQIEQASSISPQAKIAQVKDARLEPKGASFTPGDYVKYKAAQSLTPSTGAVKTPVDNYSVLGQNIIPINQSDKPIAKVGKGIVNYGLGTIGRVAGAIGQAGMQLVSNTDKAIHGQPLDFSQKSLKNDILPKQYGQFVDNLAQKGPAGSVASGFVQGAESLLDPGTWIGGAGILDNMSKAGTFGKAAKAGTAENLAVNASRGQKAVKNMPLSAQSATREYLNAEKNAAKKDAVKTPNVIFASDKGATADNLNRLALPSPTKQEPFTQVKYSTVRVPRQNIPVKTKANIDKILNQNDVFVRTVRTPQKDIQGRISTPSGKLGINMGLQSPHEGVSGFKGKDYKRLYEWMTHEGWQNENVVIYKGKPTNGQNVIDRGEVEFNPSEIIAAMPTKDFINAKGDIRSVLSQQGTKQVGEGVVSSKTILPRKQQQTLFNVNANIEQPFKATAGELPRPLKPTGNINALPTNKIPINGVQTGSAVWKNKSFDQPVNVTGDLGTINGRRYVKVEGSNTGVPLDEIKYGNGAQSVTGTSQFKTNTLKNAEWLQGDAQKVVDNVNATYGIKTDVATVQKVNQQLSNGYQSAIDRIKQNGLQSKEDSVASGIIAQNLRQEAKTTGDYTKLKDWLQTVTPEVTNTAQTLQGLSTWKTMTAEGALSKAQQVVDGVNRDLAKANPKAFKNGKNAVLSNEDIKFISNQMDKVGAMPDGYMKDMEFARVKQLIADKIPATTRDKFRGLQRLSLIGNPKTLITRNPGGNIILGAAENIKDMPGAVIDAITSKIRGSARTTAFNPIPKVIDQAKGFGQGIGAMAKDVKYGVDTSPTRGMMELPQGRIFKSPVLNALDNVERKVLQLGDRPFYQGAYNSRINELMKLNKVTAPTEEMIQEAKLYALDRVFQNNSALSKWAGNLRRSSGIIGDLVMPFTQTPANVLDKLIDYTPGGFIKGMAQIGKNAKTGIFDQKLFVDRLARSLTGAGITMVGYTMAKNGMVTGSVPTDKDATAFQKSLGWQPYSIKIGDKYYSYNWAQPIAGLIAAGVDAYNAGKDKKDLLSQIGAGTTAAANTIINQSFLQGVVQMMSGYSPVAGFTNSMLSTPTQAAPTAGNQIRQLIDPYQRETYSPNALQKSANAVINRVPFASATLPKKVDVMGNDVKNFQGNNNAWNVMLNPGFTTTYNPNATQAEIMRLYNESGLNVQIPTVAPKSVKWQGQTYQFTPQEFTQYQTTLGQQTMDAYNKVMATPEYQQASDPDKAKMLQSAISDAKSNATFEVLQGRGLVHNPLVLSMPSSLTKNKIPIKLTPDQQAALADAISAKQQKFKDFYKAAYTDKRAAEARTKAEKEFGRTLK